MADKKKKKTNIFIVFIKSIIILFKAIIALIIIGSILGLSAFSVLYYKIKPSIDSAMQEAYDRLASIDEGTFMKYEDTIIYDSTDSKIGEINISNYKYVDIKDISKYIQDGYIAVEDRNFAIHNGIDLKAITRAAKELVKRKGEITQGGSTITQQVLKNNVIGLDMNVYQRKILELFLAPEFEKQFSKADIMEFYCNTNFYSNNCYGVEAASQYYFGKRAKDVSLAEAAGLIGISNNPSKYNPIVNPENYIEKRDFVLGIMLQEGKISQEQYNTAIKEELNLVLERDSRIKESYNVSFALHCAALKLMELDGFDFKYVFNTQQEYEDYKELYNTVYLEKSNQVRNGGYTIYTSFNMDYQAKLQNIIDTQLSKFLERAEDGRYKMQGSATVIDNQTGYVVALVGGRGTEDEYNRAYQGARQPGSSIKPLAVYAPSFETGYYYPSLKINDTAIANGPKNAGGGYRGNTSIREAVGRSINTIAWRIYQDLKPESAIKYLGDLKFSYLSYQDTYNTAMSLGGFTYGATSFEMAKGYSTLANLGEFRDVDCITKIEYQDGSVIYNGDFTVKSVYTPDAAYLMLDSLKGVVNSAYGTGRGYGVPKQEIAAKTGTTNDSKDRWFCGTSPYYAMAVWTGYDIPRDMGGYANYPASIFKEMMVYLHENKSSIDFQRPETVYEANVDYAGRQVNYKSGRKDLFSGIARDKLEAQRIKAEEQALKEAAEKERKEQEKLETSIKSGIEELRKIEIANKNDLILFDSKYTSLQKQIDKVASASSRRVLLSDLDSAYSATNSLLVVEDMRREIEEERRLEEEERKKEQERQERINKIARANENIHKLAVTWTVDNYKLLVEMTKRSVEACIEYEEYIELREKLDSLLSILEIEYETALVLKEQEEFMNTPDTGGQTDQTDPTDPTEHTENTEPTGDTDQTDQTEPKEPTEPTDQIGDTEPTESKGQADQSEQTNQVEQAGSTTSGGSEDTQWEMIKADPEG